jgi:hypothetical protein
MHTLAALAAVPVDAEYLPATQLMQAVRPAVLYLPATQSMHTLSAVAAVPVAAEYLPAVQLMQALSPAVP